MSVDSNVKKLKPLSEDIHVTTQGYMQQHDVEWRHEHPGGHTSWRESTTMRFMNIQMGHSKMRSDSNEYMWDTTGAIINSWRIKIALESYFEKHAQEVWRRNRMDPDMHTMLSDTNNLQLMELYFQKLREQSKKDDQLKTAGEIIGSVPETSLDWDPILKERGGFWE